MGLFTEGGPHRVRRTGPEQFELSVTVPRDESGMVGRECTTHECAPGYFKIKPGTGIAGEQRIAYCPYCRAAGDPTDFHTRAQTEYAQQVALNEVLDGVNEMFRNTLGLDSRGTKTVDGGLISIEMSLSPARPTPVRHPAEAELRRDLTCRSCGLEHAVFGLAVWCPDCGTDLFLDHVRAELDVLRHVLAAIPERKAQLGARVAARDIENALEDVVSIFEAVLKAICRSNLLALQRAEDDVAKLVETKIRNRFQSVTSAAEAFRETTGRELFEGQSVESMKALADTFEKRHPITHNLGIIDPKYMRRVKSGELLGREIRVSADEVLASIDTVERIFAHAHLRPEPPRPDQDAAP